MEKRRLLGSGFTLIELMIVVAIIGLLAAIVIGALTLSTKRARDAHRLQDLRAIATLLEFHYADTGRYPVASGLITSCGMQGPNWIPDGSDYEWAAAYTASVPRDPAENCGEAGAYSYAYQSDGSQYDLTARLEGGSPDSSVFFNGTNFQSVTAPVSVAIGSPISSPTNQSPIPVTITFSRAVVNFTQSSLSVVRGIISGFSQTLATTYSLFVTPTDNDTVIVSINSGSVQDAEGIGNLSAQYVITYDSVAPHPALSPDPAPGSVSGPFTAHVNFTKAVANFSAGDIVVTNGSASNLVSVAPGANVNFNFTVTPQNPGPVTVFIPAGVANSAAGNSNVASNTLTTAYAP